MSSFSCRVSEFSCHISGCCQVFDTLEGYEHHYNTLHRNVCSFCKRSFPSGHLLDIHISEWHDSLFQIMAEKQNMVSRCAQPFARGWCAQHGLASFETDRFGGAPVSLADTACLFPLPCSFPPAFQYKCLVEGCAEKFKSSKDRKGHLVTVHLYPADFRFDRPKKVKR